MAGERKGHLLNTTALVHEALVKLAASGDVQMQDRPTYFRSAAMAMRQILIDHARAAASQKRGGGRARVDLTSNVLATVDRARNTSWRWMKRFLAWNSSRPRPRRSCGCGFTPA
jgi:hypothetical protein